MLLLRLLLLVALLCVHGAKAPPAKRRALGSGGGVKPGTWKGANWTELLHTVGWDPKQHSDAQSSASSPSSARPYSFPRRHQSGLLANGTKAACKRRGVAQQPSSPALPLRVSRSHALSHPARSLRLLCCAPMRGCASAWTGPSRLLGARCTRAWPTSTRSRAAASACAATPPARARWNPFSTASERAGV